MGLFRPNVDKLRERGDVPGLVRAWAKDPQRSGEACGDAILSLSPDAIPQLVTLLDDEMLRGTASLGLALVGDDALPPILEMARGDDRVLQMRALGTLRKFALIQGTRDAFLEIRRLAEDGDSEVRELAEATSRDVDSQVMERLQAINQALDILEKERDPFKAREKARLIGSSRHTPVFRRDLIDGLLERTPPLPRWGVDVLREIGEPAVQPLIRAMEGGKSGLCLALAQMGEEHPAARVAVQRAAANHADRSIRAEAAEALDTQSAAG